MNEVEVSREFSAKPQEVWDVYTDHAGWRKWAGLRHSSLEVPGKPHRNGTGAVRRLGSYGLHVLEEILDFEPPKRMTYRVIKGGFPMKYHLGEVLFEACGEGTRITWRCRFDSRIPGLGGLMNPYVARFFRAALDRLARHSFPEKPR